MLKKRNLRNHLTGSSSKDFVLGIPFWRFYYDESKINYVYQDLRQLSYRDNQTNWIWSGVKPDGVGGSDLHTLPQFADLYQWMQECMDEVAQDMGMTCKLACNSSWSHMNGPDQYLYDHTHSNCFISCNYYASGHADDKTQWLHPNPYFHQTNLRPCGDWDESKYYLTHEEPTEPGKFIVFPPMIRHKSQPNSSQCARITIGSNWFPTGLINDRGVSHLNVEVL